MRVQVEDHARPLTFDDRRAKSSRSPFSSLAAALRSCPRFCGGSAPWLPGVAQRAVNAAALEDRHGGLSPQTTVQLGTEAGLNFGNVTSGVTSSNTRGTGIPDAHFAGA